MEAQLKPIEHSEFLGQKMEHKYTSTGIKFWRHMQQMGEYKAGNHNTIISTHISPEGACNLKCSYCSVIHRNNHERIELSVIKKYIDNLCQRGLKAVILTGGGEPTIYKHFNELVQWIKNKGLSVALITNGTLTDTIEDETLKCFSWVRVSINTFKDWEQKIKFPFDKVSDDCIIGCSLVFTAECTTDLFKKIANVADNCGATYIRLLPDCLLEQTKLLEQHKLLDKILLKINDSRFFHQYKVHGVPKCDTCHQSYFRPYLSEVDGGTVYPCDSVVLNDELAHFTQKYQLCKAENILDYIDSKIKAKFAPRESCKGCVFTNNVNMLDDFINDKIDKRGKFLKPLMHEEFV